MSIKSLFRNKKSLGWVELDLMGHTRRIGTAREVSMLGIKMLRIDVPTGYDRDIQTEYYLPQSIYGLRPITEEEANNHLHAAAPPPQQDTGDGIPF